MRYLATLLALFALTGCGQKGPLYLPENTDDEVNQEEQSTDSRREQDK